MVPSACQRTETTGRKCARRSITWLGRLAYRSARFDHNGSVGRHAFVLLGAHHALCVPHVTAATLNRLTQETVTKHIREGIKKGHPMNRTANQINREMNTVLDPRC